jgi:hypothetical protein
MTSLQETAMGGGDTTAKTASYVLVAADAGTVVAMNAAGATTITVNTSLFAAGDTVTIQNRGAGVCTVTAGTATVVTAGSLALAQNEGGILYFTATGAAVFYDFVQSSGSTIPTSLEFTAGKNKIINGDFGVWQRGTSFSPTPGVETYTADRWVAYVDGTTTSTFSRQSFTPGTAPVSGYESSFFYRALITSQTGGSGSYIYQKIEDVRTFANQTVTMSLWAKAAASGSASIYLTQNFGSGGSGTVNGTPSTINLTTSWQRFTYSVAVPSISGKTIGTGSFLAFYVQLTANLAQTVDIWGVQVEESPVATAFQTATGTIQGELAACQRYFYRWNGDVGDAFCYVPAHCQAYSTTQATGILQMPQTMRTKPSFTAGTIASFAVTKSDNTVTATTAIAGDTFNPDSVALTLTAGASTFTAGNSTKFLRNSSATSTTLDFSAEL